MVSLSTFTPDWGMMMVLTFAFVAKVTCRKEKEKKNKKKVTCTKGGAGWGGVSLMVWVGISSTTPAVRMTFTMRGCRSGW